MENVIVTGSTGFIGYNFVKYLIDQNIEVLALGRKDINKTKFAEFNSKFKNFQYLKINMEDITSLPERINQIGWGINKNIIFYNFAWGGKNSLADGNISDQIKNAEFSANAVQAAKNFGCQKFINIGTQEERIIERYLESKKWIDTPYHSSMGVYAVSKLASKDICRLLSYLNKIDYIHVRFSAIIDEEKLNSGYISKVLDSILQKKEFEVPKDSELFDIISIKDAVEAFYLIGKYGTNKDEFFIGSGKPKTLNEFFENFNSYINNEPSISEEQQNFENSVLTKADFKVDYLYKKTGFIPNSDIYKNIQNFN